MIYFRKFRNEDLEKINEILLQEKIYNMQIEGIIYVAIEDEEIIGVGKAKEDNQKWFLEYIVVKKEMRGKGLGDGLLRVISNSLFKKGIDRLYSQEKSEFLVNKGFIKDENLYKLNIEELFEHNCNNCGG
ncbi:MAG: GNAT family N-acetyltransferase [Tissierellia bacterium]|nr:GNAT family N-acetyltransferase [Tissierellia bacterium]